MMHFLDFICVKMHDFCVNAIPASRYNSGSTPFYNIYFNDLPNCLLNSEPRMYADDTHLTFASNNIQNINTVLNDDLARVEKWLTANKLTLNASKTEFMLIGSRQRLSTFHNPPSLMIDGAPITQVTSTKSLGVYIDETLSWNVHVEILCKK